MEENDYRVYEEKWEAFARIDPTPEEIKKVHTEALKAGLGKEHSFINDCGRRSFQTSKEREKGIFPTW